MSVLWIICCLFSHHINALNKTANLSVIQPSSNGASVKVISDTATVSNEWYITVTQQTQFNLLLSLDSSWGLHQSLPSIITIEFHGSWTHPTNIDSEFLTTFTVGDQYLMTEIEQDTEDDNGILPQCGNPIYNLHAPSLYHGNVTSLLEDESWDYKSCKLLPSDRGCNKWKMWPENEPYGNITDINDFPLTFILKNDPISNTLSVTYSSSSNIIDFNQNCMFQEAFDSSDGLNVYISGNENGNEFSLSSINVHYHDSDSSAFPTYFPTFSPTQTPTKSPTISTKHPTINPTQIPSKYPSSFPSKNPTLTPPRTDIQVQDISTSAANTPTMTGITKSQQTDNGFGINDTIILLIGIGIGCVTIAVCMALFTLCRWKRDQRQKTTQRSTMLHREMTVNIPSKMRQTSERISHNALYAIKSGTIEPKLVSIRSDSIAHKVNLMNVNLNLIVNDMTNVESLDVDDIINGEIDIGTGNDLLNEELPPRIAIVDRFDENRETLGTYDNEDIESKNEDEDISPQGTTEEGTTSPDDEIQEPSSHPTDSSKYGGGKHKHTIGHENDSSSPNEEMIQQQNEYALPERTTKGGSLALPQINDITRNYGIVDIVMNVSNKGDHV